MTDPDKNRLKCYKCYKCPVCSCKIVAKIRNDSENPEQK